MEPTERCHCCGESEPEPGRTICADCIEADCLISFGCSKPLDKIASRAGE